MNTDANINTTNTTSDDNNNNNTNTDNSICRPPGPRRSPATDQIGTPDPKLEPRITSLDKCNII